MSSFPLLFSIISILSVHSFTLFTSPGHGASLWRGSIACAISQLYAASDSKGVVVATVVVCVEKLFEPLQELKVVLKPALNQSIDRDDLEGAAAAPGLRFFLSFFRGELTRTLTTS